MHLKCFWYPHARWRIFHKPIRATVENAENYTLEFLHNYLRVTDKPITPLLVSLTLRTKMEIFVLENGLNNNAVVDLPCV